MKKLLITILLLCVIAGNAVYGARRNRITDAQARALVMASLHPGGDKLANLSVMSPQQFGETAKEVNATRFVIYTVVSSVGEGVELYPVDFYTGDVFNPIMECYEIKNKKLRALQKKVRRSLHLTDAQYRKIKTGGPSCAE
jgi:hypothetical protein